ncbi:MAG TPA: hypothetical protein VGB18_08085, partial [Candidatus Thermoplasmatota archaeon]
MNQRRAGLFATLLVGVLLASSLISYVNAAGAGQNDAGTGSDADDTRNMNDNDVIGPGRHQGQLVASTDTADWYKIQGGSSRATYEVLLQSLTGNNALDLELHNSLSVEPIHDGGGANGVWAFQRQITGDVLLKVGLAQGGTTGKYELVISRHFDNDNNDDADAGAGTSTKSLGSLPGGRKILEGNLSITDASDVYSFDVPAGTNAILAGVHFTPTAALTLTLEPSTGFGGTAFPSQQRSGPGFVTAFHAQVGAAGGSTWLVKVERTDANAR